MSKELPVVQLPTAASIPDGQSAPAADVRRFLAELESVAESCQTPKTRTNSGQKPQTYLEPIAKKYSFAPPRKDLKALYETKQPKAFEPTRLLEQLKRATKTLIDSVSHPHRKP